MPVTFTNIALALVMLALASCSPNAAETDGKTPSAQGSQINAITDGARIRMAWPGIEEAGGLPGDIVTLTSFKDDTLKLEVIMEDANGSGIPAHVLRLVSTNGNAISNPMPVTDRHGRVTVSITAKTLGKDVIHVSGAGVRKILNLAVRSVADLPADNVDNSATASSTDGAPHVAPINRSDVVLPQMPGVLPWKTLADGVRLRQKDGLYQLIVTDGVKALTGKTVKLQGFMLPLEEAGKQKHFLLTANPPTCFFCLPGGAESIVEVRCEKPIEFGFDPIVVHGTLEVLNNDELGLVYRMTRATKVDG